MFRSDDQKRRRASGMAEGSALNVTGFSQMRIARPRNSAVTDGLITSQAEDMRVT